MEVRFQSLRGAVDAHFCAERSSFSHGGGRFGSEANANWTHREKIFFSMERRGKATTPTYSARSLPRAHHQRKKNDRDLKVI